MEANPRKVLHTINTYDENKVQTQNPNCPLMFYQMSPMGRYGAHDNDASPTFQNLVDKNNYDIQGYCKRMNDMMT